MLRSASRIGLWLVVPVPAALIFAYGRFREGQTLAGFVAVVVALLLLLIGVRDLVVDRPSRLKDETKPEA